MNRISAERHILNVTQAELGEKLGVKAITIWRWENDENANIPSSKLASMRSLFRCNIDWILGLTDVRTPVKAGE